MTENGMTDATLARLEATIAEAHKCLMSTETFYLVDVEAALSTIRTYRDALEEICDMLGVDSKSMAKRMQEIAAGALAETDVTPDMPSAAETFIEDMTGKEQR